MVRCSARSSYGVCAERPLTPFFPRPARAGSAAVCSEAGTNMHLAAKIDSSLSTWNYDSATWTDSTIFYRATEVGPPARGLSLPRRRCARGLHRRPTAATARAPARRVAVSRRVPRAQQKTNAYFMEFTRIRLDFTVSGQTTCLWVELSGTSLQAMFSSAGNGGERVMSGPHQCLWYSQHHQHWSGCHPLAGGSMQELLLYTRRGRLIMILLWLHAESDSVEPAVYPALLQLRGCQPCDDGVAVHRIRPPGAGNEPGE
jgi:hypothetical protein